MSRFPYPDSHTKYEAARQRIWDQSHSTERATSLREVIVTIRNHIAKQYEEEGIARIEHYSFDFYLSKLTDFKAQKAVGRKLGQAIDVIIEELFDEDQLAWFSRSLYVNRDKCSLGIDISMGQRFPSKRS